MWRPIFRKENLKPGDRLRKELLVGEDRLWTEYEVVETGEEGLVLKPLVSNGNAHPDIPSVYKKMGYDVLYAGSTRIWVAMEKPANPLLLKSEPLDLPAGMLQGERLSLNFLGLRFRLANPDRISVFILVIVLLFFLLIILQLLLEHK